MSPILIIAIVAVVFVVAVKLHVPLGLSFLGIAILLGLFAALPLREIPIVIIKELVAFETLRLVGIVFLLSLLGILLSEMGALTRTVESLQTIVADRRASMVIPASLIGLLPMPGGAMLSAPMVEEGGKNFKITPERLTFLNFWFRHLWEYIWPLYPGIVLSTGLLNMPVGKLIAPMWPLTLAAIFFGAFFGFRKIEAADGKDSPAPGKGKALWTFLKLTWYVWTVIVFVLFLGFDILPVVAVCALLMLLFLRRRPAKKLKIFVGAFSWRVLSLVAGVMIFKGMLENVGILERLTGQLDAVPDVLLLFAVPFSIGLLTGVNSAYVGLGFPLLLPFFLNGSFDAGNFAFAYASGFAGVLISPVHLCLALTKEYFAAEWSGIYRFLLPTAASVLAVATIILIIL